MWRDIDGNPVAFYHESTTNAIKAVIDIFSDVYIVRRNIDGQYDDRDVNATVDPVDQKGYKLWPHRVPIRFEGKDVYVQYQQAENRHDRRVGEVLPAMSLTMPTPPQLFSESGVTNDPRLQHCVPQCPEQVSTMYNGTPMKLNFELTLRANKFHELMNMYETIMSRIARPILTFSIVETSLGQKRDLRLGDVNSVWGQFDNEFEKGGNSRPMEIIISFSVSPVYYYSPITTQGTIKEINLEFRNLCHEDPDSDDAVLVTDIWTVDPESAGEDDPHREILTQTLFGESRVIRDIEVNLDGGNDGNS